MMAALPSFLRKLTLLGTNLGLKFRASIQRLYREKFGLLSQSPWDEELLFSPCFRKSNEGAESFENLRSPFWY